MGKLQKRAKKGSKRIVIDAIYINIKFILGVLGFCGYFILQEIIKIG